MRIRIKPKENADELWTSHNGSGECAKEEKQKIQREKEEALRPKKCELEGCKTKFNPAKTNKITCSACLMDLCLHHKTPESHNCKRVITKDRRLAQSKLLHLKDQKPTI